jgi:type II secretory pathway predicted ATPase ExeA
MPTPTPFSGQTLRQLANRDERVFASYPQVSRYFPAAAIEDARMRLSRAIERGDGPGLLIGAPGTGKSLLLQVLAAQHHKQFDVALLACACLCTRRALLQAILFELGMPYKMRDEGELRLSLLDHLLSEDRSTALLLLVDEAQTLPVTLLDELRVLTNMVRGSAPRVRLVLAGSSALEEAFAGPELESFSQRLSARCYVAPFSREETCQFIRAQVAACGGAPDALFAEDAWGAVFDATDGVPRLVNQLCDRAVSLAATKNILRIERLIIQQAWSDLQQIPTPWETPVAVAEASASNVIEFGGLTGDTANDDREIDSALFDVEPTELDVDDDPVVKTQAVELLKATPSLAVRSADPFAEKFDEEEVVLDNFAAWDDMFHRESPRVQNRREPQFAALFQSAVAAAPACDPKATTQESEACVADCSSRFDAAEAGPRLRLAVVSESATLDADQRHDPILVVEDDSSPNAGNSPVRREEYRQLFSRLRSG